MIAPSALRRLSPALQSETSLYPRLLRVLLQGCDTVYNEPAQCKFSQLPVRRAHDLTLLRKATSSVLVRLTVHIVYCGFNCVSCFANMSMNYCLLFYCFYGAAYKFFCHGSFYRFIVACIISQLEEIRHQVLFIAVTRHEAIVL